jgi:AraC-like DNA-binding protein
MKLVAVAADLETAQDILSKAYGPVRIDPRGSRRGLRLERAALGPVQLHHVNVGMDFDAVGDPLETLIFGELLSGRLRQASGGSDRHYASGEAFLAAQPGHSYTATVHEADVRLTVIAPALLSEVVDTAPGRTRVPVMFTGYEAVSTQATFPNNALTDPTVGDRHDSSPATLRRAIAFIDEHAHEDISIADVAAATHVTIRAVQLAFRRHLDTTPIRYLRRVRLDHAHRQLLAADPERESVTAVAYRWGFTSSSRFAAYYRTAYGVPPSATLRAS